MPGFAPRHISVFPSPQELGSALAQLVAQRAAEAGGRFSLGLSGGSLVQILSQELPAVVASSGPAAPSRWLLAFCDERLVPAEHPDSTFGAYRTHLLTKISIPENQVVIINPSLPVEEAAADYAEKLKEEKEKIVASISDSPKPPAERITLTLPVLNAARTVVFVATGGSKSAILKRILESDEENPLPAALVQPHTGKLHWFLDESAAKELIVPFEKHSIL
ncbi:6-phosphogluconolactonase isoform X2 [Carettochelys insculpta]|uniref:6-phosphogluconolactonase isoform X2 n=1 Tax=Carettochelys insculpta TaxID=44489 RepID=UPI003EBB61A7